MAAVRHFALGCCLLCSAAGIVRIFWPENGFKPVINTVLVLYILASALPMAAGADWGELGRQLRGWARQETAPATPQSYAHYAESLAREQCAAALRGTLADAGIRAEVALTPERCTVTVQSADDAARAGPIVAAACGKLPCTVTVEGGAP